MRARLPSGEEGAAIGESSRGARAARPRLVLLPGMDGTGDLFAPFVRALPKGAEATVVRYPVDRPLGYDELLPIARAALPASGPYAIVAESFSGPIGIRIAAAAPANLRALVLVASFARNPLPRSLGWLAGAASPALFRVRPPEAALRALLVGRAAPRELVEAVARAVGWVAPGVMARRLRDVSDVDVESALSSIRVPVLYVAGARDRLVGRRGLEGIRRRLPEVESIILDAPHLVLQARPREAAAAIVEFAGRESARPRPE